MFTYLIEQMVGPHGIFEQKDEKGWRDYRAKGRELMVFGSHEQKIESKI